MKSPAIKTLNVSMMIATALIILLSATQVGVLVSETVAIKRLKRQVVSGELVGRGAFDVVSEFRNLTFTNLSHSTADKMLAHHSPAPQDTNVVLQTARLGITCYIVCENVKGELVISAAYYDQT